MVGARAQLGVGIICRERNFQSVTGSEAKGKTANDRVIISEVRPRTLSGVADRDEAKDAEVGLSLRIQIFQIGVLFGVPQRRSNRNGIRERSAKCALYRHAVRIIGYIKLPKISLHETLELLEVWLLGEE